MSDISAFRDLPELRRPDRGPDEAEGTFTLRGLLRRPWFIRLLAVGLLLFIWQWITFANSRVPGIGEIISFIIEELIRGEPGASPGSELWEPLATSLQRYGIGLAIGIPAGAALGLLLGASSVGRGLLNDTVLVLLALPAVVWAFLSSLWFGLSDSGPVLVVVLTAIPFVAVNLTSGVRSVDQGLLEMSRSFRVPLLRRVTHVLLAGTLPSAFIGVRLALMTGWNSLLIVEWFGATSGVGWQARFWYDALLYEGFAAWVILFILFITLLDRLLLSPLERRAFQWNQRPTLTFEEEM